MHLPADYYDCDGACLNDTDSDGVCDELEVPGCTDSDADNYNADATDDDGSCEFEGCTFPTACNYDPTANTDDGSCTFPETFYDCDGNCLQDDDGDGICNQLEVPGCTDTEAQNYDAAATDDDGSCEYPGCTNPDATNYVGANVDDGSCIAGVHRMRMPPTTIRRLRTMTVLARSRAVPMRQRATTAHWPWTMTVRVSTTYWDVRTQKQPTTMLRHR